jgi:hypothetical protein
MDPNFEAARRGGGAHSALPTVQQIYNVGPASISRDVDRNEMIDLVLCAYSGLTIAMCRVLSIKALLAPPLADAVSI